MLGPGRSPAGGRLNAAPAPLSAATLTRRETLAWIAVGLFLFLPGIAARDLWNPDEPRYAEVAREMLASGEFLVPHLNGEVYGHKPPLQFWSIAAAALLLRGGEVDTIAARLPAVLAAVATLLLVCKLGLRLFGRRAAWIAAAAFATSAKILWQGRIGQIDMLLVALVSAAVWFWVRSRAEERPRLVLLFWLFAGLGTLAKGPVALFPPLLAILAFSALERDGAGARSLRFGWGALVYLAVVGAWLGPATLRGGLEYLEQIAFRQTVTRYADPWHHFQPWYYYLGVVPADFFPWSLLLPAALLASWRDRWRDERLRRGVLFALCWIVVTLVFFSVSPAKRSVYILTMFPALALVAGAGLDRIASTWPRFRAWLVAPLAALAVLSAAAIFALPRLAARRAIELEPMGSDLVTWVAGLLAFLAFAALVSSGVAVRGRVGGAVAALAAGMGLVAVVAASAVLPRFDAVKSSLPLSRHLLREMKVDEPYAIYPRIDATFLFHTRKFCELPAGEDALRRYAAGPGRVWLIIRKDAARALDPPLPLVEVARDRDVEDGYLLMATPPAGRDG